MEFLFGTVEPGCMRGMAGNCLVRGTWVKEGIGCAEESLPF